MKQKIVYKVHMNCEKCNTKALKIAADSEGIDFLGLEGEQKDKLVVIGEGVDSIKLAKNLKKKFGHIDIISVAEVKSK